jgi:hypothetical protein
MERKETPITSSFLGLVKKGACPVCGEPVSTTFGISSMLLCQNCGDYLEIVDKKLRQMDPTQIAEMPIFGAPTPWPDMQAPRFSQLSLTLAGALTEMVMTKKEGVRVFDAKWPSGCCVCGKTATREESLAIRVIFAAPTGGPMRKQKEATVVVKGVPHCAEHTNGARWERALLSTESQPTVLGLFFRSYPYQTQFRKLNPLKWH